MFAIVFVVVVCSSQFGKIIYLINATNITEHLEENKLRHPSHAIRKNKLHSNDRSKYSTNRSGGIRI